MLAAGGPPVDAPSDAELLERAGRGDAGAMEELYVRHRAWTVGVAQRFMGDRDDALDVMQDAFVDLVGRLPGLRLTSSLRAWLFPVVKHLCISRLRRRNRLVAIEDADGPAPEAPLPDFALPRQLAQLSEAHREVLALRFVHDLRVAEIAQVLGVPAGTVKSRLHNALAELRGKP